MKECDSRKKAYFFDAISVFVLLVVSVWYFKRVNSIAMLLYDDNALQWLPIMERALQEFFSTGHLPTYCFYQFKGFDVFQQGYYGLYNPLIYISFLIAKLFNSTTISVYVCLCLILGNIIVYLISRKQNLPAYISVLIVVTYARCTWMYPFSQWYYSFNNYWFILLLIYSFLYFNDGVKHKYIHGLILTASLLLGNIQYSFYYGIIYALIYIGLLIFRKAEIKCFITNSIVFIVTSMPFLLGLFAVSRNNVGTFSGANRSYFLMGATSFKDYILRCISGHFAICFICLAIIGMICAVIKMIRKSFTYKDVIVFSVGISCIFFVVFMGGEKLILANIFSYIPLVNSFRFLSKIQMVLPSLFTILAIYFLGKVRNKTKVVAFAVTIISLFLCADFSFTNAYGRLVLNATEMNASINENNLDLKNYRYFSLIRSADEYYYEDSHNVSALILGNTGTSESWFGIGGYDLTYSQPVLDGTSSFLDYESLAIRNCKPVTSLSECVETNGCKVFDEMKNNSIKYIVFLNESLDDVNSLLLSNNVQYRIVPFTNTSSVVELVDAIPLIRDQNGNALPFISSMDQISINCDDDTKTVLTTFYANKNLVVEYVSSDGEKYNVKTDIDENGNIIADVSGMPDGTLYISYKNILNYMIMALSVIIILLFLGTIFQHWVSCLTLDRFREV